MNNTLYQPDTGTLVFTEWDPSGTGISWKILHALTHVDSPFQKIDLYETADCGKLLVHDGAVMLTERDESAYHEMLVHLPLLTHPDPRRVLVVGGGDGGSLREIMRHDSVELARQVEIDEEVVKVSRRYLPGLSEAFDNPRVDLVIGDGIKVVREAQPGSYEAVLVDSTDPVGPAVQLFDAPFFRDVHRALSKNGVMASQVGSTFFHLHQLTAIVKILRGIFPLVRPFSVQIPSYPSGCWGFVFASKGPDPLRLIDQGRAGIIENGAEYWNREIHRAAFAMPSYARRELESDSP